jgi:hypothetical protein
VTRRDALYRRARLFHEANPAVFAKLVEYAREAKEAGKRRIGIAACFERLRWFSEVETKGDAFKLNNNARAFYSRLLMAEVPELRGFFVTRNSGVDAERPIVVRRHARRRKGSPRPAAPVQEMRLF